MTASPTAPRSPELAILRGLPGVRQQEEEFYRELHSHPELSHQENETSSKVGACLGDDGYEVHEHLGGTGVVGVIRNGEGPTVLLRADMDALPVQEETGLAYASTVTSTDQDGNSAEG